jgi:hypothetical protein
MLSRPFLLQDISLSDLYCSERYFASHKFVKEGCPLGIGRRPEKPAGCRSRDRGKLEAMQQADDGADEGRRRPMPSSRQINPGEVFDLMLPQEDAAEGYRAWEERRAIKSLLRG